LTISKTPSIATCHGSAAPKDAVNFAGIVAADVLKRDMPVSHWTSIDKP